MAKRSTNREVTSKRAASAASKVLRNPASSKAAKTAAGKKPTKKTARKISKKVRVNQPDPLARSRDLLTLVRTSLDDDKAEEVAVIELAGKSDIADFMVVASGRSSRQVGAMAQHLREKLKGAGVTGISVEGAARADWVLIDGGDIIVHLFRPEVRAFYGLEKMWGEEFSAEREAAGTSG